MWLATAHIRCLSDAGPPTGGGPRTVYAPSFASSTVSCAGNGPSGLGRCPRDRAHPAVAKPRVFAVAAEAAPVERRDPGHQLLVLEARERLLREVFVGRQGIVAHAAVGVERD